MTRWVCCATQLRRDTADFLTRLRTFKMSSQDRREKKSKVMWSGEARPMTPPAPPAPQAFPNFEALLYTSRTELEALWASSGLGATVPIGDVVPNA